MVMHAVACYGHVIIDPLLVMSYMHIHNKLDKKYI